MLTHGLDEGILALTVAALRDRDATVPEAVVVVPAFDMYASTAAGVGARVVEVPLGPDFAFPTERILDAMKTRDPHASAARMRDHLVETVQLLLTQSTGDDAAASAYSPPPLPVE